MQATQIQRNIVTKGWVPGTKMSLLCLLKWYYDENRICPIEGIFKHKQVVCIRRKMVKVYEVYMNGVYFFQISLFVPEIFKFLEYAN